ncbi:MAG: choice-of-anchor B family protein [Longimicrobiales bacterium]
MRALLRIVLTILSVVIAASPCLAQSSAFGNSVVIGDGELIIAEPNNNFRPGTVYVYRKSGAEWREAAQLRSPGAERADGFGTVLARSGNTLFIAQRGGRVHVFERDGEGWRNAGALLPSGMTGEDPGCGNAYGYCNIRFGIALVAAGDWLLVGEAGRTPRRGRGGGGGGEAEQDEGTPGSVYAFERGPDGQWRERARLFATGSAPGDGFGSALAMAENQVLIGAPTRNASQDSTIEAAGRVHEFVLENGTWRETGSFGPEAEGNANFGAAIAISGDVALIGSPGSDDGRGALYAYSRDTGSGAWSERSRLAVRGNQEDDRFGSAIAIDGNDVWIGAPAPRGVETGTAYLYRDRLDGSGPEAPIEFRLTETVTRDAFGDRIVASGGVAAVSATGMHHQAGSVQVYERDASGAWQDRGRLVSTPDALEPLVGEERRCTDGQVGVFDCSEVELLAFVPGSMLRAPGDSRGVRTNDNWGWTDPETGREYALIGRNDGTSFIDVTDPTNPILVGDLPKTPDTPPSQLWRDMKTYDSHAFIVADGAGNHGMQVFDLRRLRDVQNPPALFEPDALYTNVASVHNIGINEESGFAYLVGAGGGGESCGGGLHMVDIREPLNPKFMGCFRDQRGTHDVQCVNYKGPDQRYHNREICLKSNASIFAISDVTDKANPQAISRASHPNPAYLHQGWLTEDQRYFFMDDESDVIRGTVPTTRTLVWDLSDLEDPILATEFMGSMPASAHNQYVKDNYSYQANYRYGLHVLDITDPENPREVGNFDTSPYQVGPGFSGAWSTYPFFASGTIIVTSLQEGVFFLKKRERIIS